MTSAVLIALGLLHAVSNTDTSWTLVKTGNGVAVWNRPAPGSSLDAFRGVGRDTVDIDFVETILRDLPGFTRWVPYLAESRVVRHIDADHFLVYQLYALPWPFSDRDIVVEIHVHRDDSLGMVRASMKAAADPAMPPIDGRVRLTDMDGEIQLRRLGPRLTEGQYTERLNLGGSVPSSINHLIAQEIPARILVNLRAECERRKR